MKIGIIGSGISGIVAAEMLQNHHEITLFEAAAQMGGHTHTVTINEENQSYAIDTGFIVFNLLTYPNFHKFLNRLNTSYQASEMSFSVKSESTGLEYNGTSLNTLFAQRKNIFNLSFHKMLREIIRFNEETKKYVQQRRAGLTLGQFLNQGGFSETFTTNYLYPMTAAIWSANPQELNEFPFTFLANFFENHKMLDWNNRPVWQVVKGGSHSYLKAFEKGFKGKIKLSCPVKSVNRVGDKVIIETEQSNEEFDEVVIATHSDQALKLLSKPTNLEKEILSSFLWQKNVATLHTDVNIMPVNKRAWASWNYFLSSKQQTQACVTYYMNRLQSLNSKNNYFVSLNASEYIDPKKIIKSIIYHHPVYNEISFQNQYRHSEISGKNKIHYCGAYWGYGFHEDGVKSALKVVKHWGINI